MCCLECGRLRLRDGAVGHQRRDRALAGSLDGVGLSLRDGAVADQAGELVGLAGLQCLESTLD